MARHESLRHPAVPLAQARRSWARVFPGKAALIPAHGVTLPGELAVPVDPRGVVVFAHGSGSSRLSPRNLEVARILHESHLATLLFDLLKPDEAGDRRRVFDIGLLAERLLAATRWLDAQPEVAKLSLGYFGASTGAAAALVAASSSGARVCAVVSRGGRPDLAGERLPHVRAATLLVVGGADDVVLELNRTALAALRCERELVVVPGATHLFEEPGALERVANLATRWFCQHLGTSSDRCTAGVGGAVPPRAA